MKQIPGFERYSITRNGVVYSHCRRTNNKRSDGRVAQKLDKDGYAIVALYAGGKRHDLKVHRLVMLTYYGPPPKGAVVDHVKGDKADNRASRLEYVTQSVNAKRAFRLGLRVGLVGANNPMCKIHDPEALLAEARSGTAYSAIAEKFGLSKTHVSRKLRSLGYYRYKVTV